DVVEHALDDEGDDGRPLACGRPPRIVREERERRGPVRERDLHAAACMLRPRTTAEGERCPLLELPDALAREAERRRDLRERPRPPVEAGARPDDVAALLLELVDRAHE